MVGMADDEPNQPPETPVYDQAFFLDLARPRPGETHEDVRERWNAWRSDPANSEIRVNFGEVDFRNDRNKYIRFDGFYFGDYANFALCIFSDNSNFANCIFGINARFFESIFTSASIFTHSIFGEDPRFDKVIFQREVDFSFVEFQKVASFWGSVFLRGVVFRKTNILGHILFLDSIFVMKVEFYECKIGAFSMGGSARHWMSDYDGSAYLGANIDNIHKIRGDVGVSFKEKFVSPYDFSNFHFYNCEIGTFSIVDRKISWFSSISSCKFANPPIFERVTGIHLLDFSDFSLFKTQSQMQIISGVGGVRYIVQLRAFRSQVEGTRNYDLERDLYIEERKAERGIYARRYRDQKRWGALAGHRLWSGIMGLYWAFADYGRSWQRPAVWLGASIPTFHILYGWVLADRREAAVKLVRKAEEKAWDGKDALALVKSWSAAETRVLADYDATVGQLAVSNAVPFVGPLTIDGDAKKFLFCGVWSGPKSETSTGATVEACRPIPPPGFQVAMIGQNVLSIVLVFFIGLALRNYFRVK